MRLILATLALAVALGLLSGGRISALAAFRVRWSLAAVVGLALQMVPVPGRTWPMILLVFSFVLLTVFAVVNARAGVIAFVPILVGVLMNFTVIAVNHGMPVSKDALVASHQESTLPALEAGAGAKHHLAGPDDRLMAIADVIPLGPLHQVVSAGDILAYGGVVWLIIVAMRARERRPVAPERSPVAEASS